ncbi:hypothetical protein ACQJBY_061833 [Aegilops geniculata]
MATMPPTSIVFSVIVFMLLSTATATQANGSVSARGKTKATNLIVEACKNASDYWLNITEAFCLATLQSDNRSAEAKNLLDLVLVSIDIFKGHVTKVGVDVKKMLQNAKKGTIMMHALRFCEVDYETVLGTLNICEAIIREYQAEKGGMKSSNMPRCVDLTRHTVIECLSELADMPWAETLIKENEELGMLVDLNTNLLAPYNVRD